VNSKHKNPYRRVAPATAGLKHFDREKYADLLLKAAETILSPIHGKLSFNGSLGSGLERFL
jgi:hypothetical protein